MRKTGFRRRIDLGVVLGASRLTKITTMLMATPYRILGIMAIGIETMMEMVMVMVILLGGGGERGRLDSAHPRDVCGQPRHACFRSRKRGLFRIDHLMGVMA